MLVNTPCLCHSMWELLVSRPHGQTSQLCTKSIAVSSNIDNDRNRNQKCLLSTCGVPATTLRLHFLIPPILTSHMSWKVGSLIIPPRCGTGELSYLSKVTRVLSFWTEREIHSRKSQAFGNHHPNTSTQTPLPPPLFFPSCLSTLCSLSFCLAPLRLLCLPSSE